jgi:hypothetical protein
MSVEGYFFFFAAFFFLAAMGLSPPIQLFGCFVFVVLKFFARSDVASICLCEKKRPLANHFFQRAKFW